MSKVFDEKTSVVLRWTDRFELSDFVPDENRGAWLEAHPTVAAALRTDKNRMQCYFWASPTAWERAGYAIHSDGSVAPSTAWYRWTAKMDPLVRRFVEGDTIQTDYLQDVVEKYLTEQIAAEGQSILGLDDEKFSDWYLVDHPSTEEHFRPILDATPGLRERLDSARQAEKDRTEAWEAKKAEEKAEEEAKEKAMAEAKEKAKADAKAKKLVQRAQIEAIVYRIGTPEQKGRWRDGFMSIDEGRDLVEDEAFAALDAWPVYRGIETEDYCNSPEQDDGDNCHDREIEVIEEGSDKRTKAMTLSDAQYSRLLKIKEALPDATYTVQWHAALCQHPDCPPTLIRIGVKATLNFEGIKYAREYALDEM